MPQMLKQKIVIADDSDMNREMLRDMLSESFEIIEALDGLETIKILQSEAANIDILLLDLMMPNLDGFGVLEIMKERHWIEDIPVIIISAENSHEAVKKAYSLGVTDFIMRPFDPYIVKQRVLNTMMLSAKRKRLAEMVSAQIYEKEKNNNMMVNILSHIVEFRNGESGLHVLHIKKITSILLNKLVTKTEKYKLNHKDINLISMASSLHDIGKIAIPSEILNKPGRLTPEEFTVMKTHSMTGAQMLENVPLYQSEPLVKYAYEICRWHHERYDGRGYPDGLKGEEIPISAQIVSIADVYDALTSERVYKKAYSHDVAMNMILNGECGVFNPLVVECLIETAEEIKIELSDDSMVSQDTYEIQNVVDELSQYPELRNEKKAYERISLAKQKYDFGFETCDEAYFEFLNSPNMLILNPFASKLLNLPTVIVNPENDLYFKEVIGSEQLHTMIESVKNLKPNQNGEVFLKLSFDGKEHRIIYKCFKSEVSDFVNVMGRIYM